MRPLRTLIGEVNKYEQKRIPYIPGFDLFYINLFFILFRVFVVERRLHKGEDIGQVQHGSNRVPWLEHVMGRGRYCVDC